MSLFLATIIVGLILLIKGGLLLWSPSFIVNLTNSFHRSNSANIILFGSASIWVLWDILHLSKADFGDYKYLIFLAFCAISIGSFIFVKELLAIRGWAILILLFANIFLNAAYMEPQTAKLFLISFIYFMICVALYVGTLPYKLRDFLEWLYQNPKRSKIIGTLLSLYGLILLGSAFTY